MSRLEEALARLGLQKGALAGQVAVVTGAGRGIGREVARALALLGAKVAIAARSENGQETEALIRRAGGEALFVRTDVGAEADIERLGRTVEAELGPVDILVNNAIVAPVRSLLEMSAAEFEQVLRVNLIGAFLTCRRFLPSMQQRRRGTIVNMISTEAFPHLSAYIASKKGLEAMTHSLAAEVGRHGVSVVAFAPGFVDTPGLNAIARELAPRIGTRPERFVGLSFHRAYVGSMPAEDSGAATAYLVAVLARDVHGQTVDAYQVLEQAGFFGENSAAGAPGPAEVAATSVGSVVQEAAPADTVPAGAAAERAGNSQVDPERIAALAGDLAAALAETDAEFRRLPMVFRPLAMSGFKSKSGRSLQDWTRAVSQLCGLVPALRGGKAALPPDLRHLGVELDRLARYFREVPDEMAAFTKDPGALAEARRRSEARVRTIAELQAELTRLG